MKRKFRNLRRDEEKKHFDMLNFCFNPWGSEEKWRSKYCQEGFDISENVTVVEENGEWIGGCTAWFRDAFLKRNRKVKVQLSGDGYTLPHHTGKGVYATCVQSTRDPACKNGACAGFGFVTLYGGPFVSLLKLGYVDLFHPTTKILVLNPEKFFQYICLQAEYVHLPEKFEGIMLRMFVSIKYLKGTVRLCRVFQIKDRKLWELAGITDKKTDLQISTDIETLFKFFRYFHFRRKIAFLVLLVAFLRGRFRVRFSLKFLKTILGL